MFKTLFPSSPTSKALTPASAVPEVLAPPLAAGHCTLFIMNSSFVFVLFPVLLPRLPRPILGRLFLVLFCGPHLCRAHSIEIDSIDWPYASAQCITSLNMALIVKLSFLLQVIEGTANAGKDFRTNPSSLIQFDPGVAKRSWQTEIVEDHIEEADEKFEVLLVSPEATVIGRISKAELTIRDSGNGQCWPNQDQQAPLLGGKEIRSDTYPQHGSIRLEKLPLATQSVIWGRGDSISSPREHLPKKILRIIAPSSVFHNGTDVVYTYHGIMQMQVEDEMSPSRKSRKANIRVVSREPQHQVPGLLTEAKSNTPKDELKAQMKEQAGEHMCPQGWTFKGGHCYIVSTKPKLTWSAANRTCRERFMGSLASVLSKSDMDWLWDFSGRKPFWIGLNSREAEGWWEWAGGEPVSYTNWRKTPPRSKMKRNRKCVLVWRNAKWQIRDCKRSRAHPFVCSVKL
ncbi:FRAS1-related extracellular matrix protein 1-like isoform X2 [Poecilia latipinna]|uniref:FRAS1-related extracellular matrix protein 1-like isoform X2 n=1 Tax=Poecilia latipinna TaxID=48699 RepID=UPI00072E8F18|nr:PREDICTED: FRAS1-related extracellular matrix protein 1-like isoform X2 [Poecilia latipinna]